MRAGGNASRGKRTAITLVLAVILMGIAVSGRPPDARADTTVNETWTLPAEAGKGFVLTVGDRSVYTPRLTSASVTVAVHDSTAVYTFSTATPSCPEGTSPVLGVQAWSPAVSVSAAVSATISGTTTGPDGSPATFQETAGPVPVQGSLASGLSLPPVAVCEVASTEPDPEPSPSASPSPSVEVSPSPSPSATASPEPEPTPAPSPTASPEPEPTPTPTPTVMATPEPQPSACTKGCSAAPPKKCKKDC